MVYGKSENVKLTFFAIVHETEKARLFRFRSVGPKGVVQFQEVWLPDSQVQVDGNVVEMPEWLAVEKGIDNYVD